MNALPMPSGPSSFQHLLLRAMVETFDKAQTKNASERGGAHREENHSGATLTLASATYWRGES